MIITDIGSNMEELKKIHDNSFPFPEKIAFSKCVIDNGVLVGAGFVRFTAEGILVIDKSLPNLTKVRAIKNLTEYLIPYVKRMGLDDCHAFVKDQKMSSFLEYIGFRKCIGIPMVIDF